MQATIFYQTKTDNAIPLVLFSNTAYTSTYSTLNVVDKNSLEAQQFKGDLGQLVRVSDSEGKTSKYYVGAGEGFSDALAIATAACVLPVGVYVVQTPVSKAALVAWSLAQYQFDRYKTLDLAPKQLVVSEDELADVLIEANAIYLVRDLINTPANDLGPKELGDVVEKMAVDHGAECEQWVGDDLLKNNFPAIYAVGRASAAPPRLLSLCWGDKSHPHVTLVGKGVCFDSGGLDLKPASGMRLMKKDMGGAAQALGLAQWLMAKRVPIYLQVLIPAVENVVDAQAYRPGDVLTMRNGLTVEIHNTDAEGRLVLADALVKACEEKPELIIDFATLTGAARVAVGTDLAALFTNDDALARDLDEAALKVNDPMWRLPLFQGYGELFGSKIADFSNASESAYGGAITAALFLQRFIAADVPWAHFDIMAWNMSSKPGKPEGGEAMAIRAVAEYLCGRYAR